MIRCIALGIPLFKPDPQTDFVVLKINITANHGSGHAMAWLETSKVVLPFYPTSDSSL